MSEINAYPVQIHNIVIDRSLKIFKDVHISFGMKSHNITMVSTYTSNALPSCFSFIGQSSFKQVGDYHSLSDTSIFVLKTCRFFHDDTSPSKFHRLNLYS